MSKPEPSVKNFRSIRDYLRALVEQAMLDRDHDSTSGWIKRRNDDSYSAIRVVIGFLNIQDSSGLYVDFHDNAFRVMIPRTWRSRRSTDDYYEALDIVIEKAYSSFCSLMASQLATVALIDALNVDYQCSLAISHTQGELPDIRLVGHDNFLKAGPLATEHPTTRCWPLWRHVVGSEDRYQRPVTKEIVEAILTVYEGMDDRDRYYHYDLFGDLIAADVNLAPNGGFVTIEGSTVWMLDMKRTLRENIEAFSNRHIVF